MVFKPFKPPLIRKPETTESQEQATSNNSLPKEDLAPGAKTQPTPVTRKPLHQAGNVGKESAGKMTPASEPIKLVGDEKFFNALWYALNLVLLRGLADFTLSIRRKPSAKKNKTWDGDGILTARAGVVILRDVGGKDMGRTRFEADLEPGKMLYVGGKEVEVDSEIPRREYLAGRNIVQATQSAPAQQKNARKTPLTALKNGDNQSKTLGRSGSLKRGASALDGDDKGHSGFGAYKKPYLDDSILPTHPVKVVPRHDPTAPGALVMPRPTSVPDGKQIVDVVVDPLLTKSLRPHQREGIQFLYECVMGMRSFNGEGAILADEMGMGKTLQTIALLWTLLKQNPIYGAPPVIKKALIVCPVTLINNWRKEFRKWLGNERIGVFVFDDNRKRLTDFTKGKSYSIMIVGYEKLRTAQEGLAKGAGVDIIIADEGHRLKTLSNKSGQAIQSLNAAKRVILSGTPIQNDLSEFFAAVDLVNPGILGTFKGFVKDFETPIVRSRQPEATRKEIEKGEFRSEELRELTSKFILRRTADILAKYLPPKTEYVLFCNPTRSQATIYQAVLASPIFQSAMGNSESALQLITILKKLCNSPSLLTAKNNNSPSETITALLASLPQNLMRHFSPSASAKVRVLDQILDNMRSNTSEKIVLVSNYTSTLNLLATLLTSLGLPFLRLDGSTPAQKRQPLVDDFNRLPADKCFAFLLSAKAGGMGLNLIGASRLILFDVDWNPATDIQAMARIHRDGQKHHCRIYRVILKGSLEEKIWQRQVTKLGLADSVMEHKNSVAQFSTAELRDLFRLDEESRCQTHDLLGCDCGGKGISAPSSGVATPNLKTGEDEDSNSELSELSDASDEEPAFPKLIKASEVDMEEQERSIRDSSRRGRKQKDSMHQSMAQYAHIDPSLLVGDDEEMATIIDDDVLLSLLKDEGNRIGYIFKKINGAEVESQDTTASDDAAVADA
ncbi:DNA repair and recombination protein [Penicillium lividum]|nr:DNA repair and recombination protein [Penicillium lividum]